MHHVYVTASGVASFVPARSVLQIFLKQQTDFGLAGWLARSVSCKCWIAFTPLKEALIYIEDFLKDEHDTLSKKQFERGQTGRAAGRRAAEACGSTSLRPGHEEGLAGTRKRSQAKIRMAVSVIPVTQGFLRACLGPYEVSILQLLVGRIWAV